MAHSPSWTGLPSLYMLMMWACCSQRQRKAFRVTRLETVCRTPGVHAIFLFSPWPHHRHCLDRLGVFARGYLVGTCGTWKVAGQDLQRCQRSRPFTYLGMLFHGDWLVKHATRARYSKACASVGAICACHSRLECAKPVQSLMRLHPAILQP